MNKCKTCRYFGSERGVINRYDDYMPTQHRSCLRIIHGNGCENDTDPATELAVVTDGSGYAARLCVLPDFGCVLHEDRDR